ncbi:MAG: hypothetical protein OSB70_10095 [Myxococcota bacterium]|nr:hypothetical protein [Myxococcota bacterium]
MRPAARTLFRLQAGAWASLLLFCIGLLGHAILFDEDVPFVRQGAGPAWIMAPLPRTADLVAVDPAAPPAHVFRKFFEAQAGDTGARLKGTALRTAELQINGETLPLLPRGGGWKQGFEADLSDALIQGRNEIRLSVVNPSGPALLQASIVTSLGTTASDSSWTVTRISGSKPGAVATQTYAQTATDLALNPESRQLPTPLEIAPRQGLILLLVFGLAALAAWRRPALLARVPSGRWPRLVLASITLFWLALFAFKFVPMPLALGFDASAHLAYIDYLRVQHALPTAAHGFSTYHPPLFYLLTGAGVELFGAEGNLWTGRIVYRALPFACGLSNVWLTGAVARRLWPGEALKPSLALAVAGLLPMNIYMSAYVSNEPMLAAWISGAIALTTAILLAERVKLAHWAGLSALLGAALLTKFTALGVAPVIAFFASLRAWWLDGKGPAHAAAVLAGLSLGAVSLAGWFYWRNWVLFGDPLVWNLDIPGGLSWWMRPGFHTADWYLSFGESLVHPLFAGYASFWDGIYSTLWGDGLVAGMARVATRHGFWNDSFQLLTYPLALPATGCLVIGAGQVWLKSFTSNALPKRLVYSLLASILFLLAFSLVLISLQLAFYAQAKAFYLLCAVLPLAIAGAEGLSAVSRWIQPARATWRRALHCAGIGWLASLTASIGLSFLG